MGARQNLVIAARAAGVQCFDTVYTDLDNMEGFRQDVETIHLMGFDGKSIINPRQINVVHDIYTPKQKDIIFAEKVVREIDEKKAQGIKVLFDLNPGIGSLDVYLGMRTPIEGLCNQLTLDQVVPLFKWQLISKETGETITDQVGWW